MSDIKYWEPTAGGNNKGAPPDYPSEGYDFGMINNTHRETMAAVRRQYEDSEWVWGFPDDNVTTTVISGTVLRISGDQTAEYHLNRRIRVVGSTTGTIYGYITDATFSGGNTDVTVEWDSGSMNTEDVSSEVGLTSADNTSLPRQALNAAPGAPRTYGRQETSWLPLPQLFQVAARPDQDADSGAGYMAGDRISVTGDRSSFLCVDASAGAAVWSQDGVLAGDEQILTDAISPHRRLLIGAGGGLGTAANVLTIKSGAQLLMRRRLSASKGGPAARWVTLTGDLSVTVGAAVGPGGLDTGAWAYGWYRIFVSQGSSGQAAFAVALGGSPFNYTEPDWSNLSGYDDEFAVVTTHITDPTITNWNFQMVQRDDRVASQTQIFSNLANVTRTAQDLSNYAPPALEFEIGNNFTPASTSARADIFANPDSSVSGVGADYRAGDYYIGHTNSLGAAGSHAPSTQWIPAVEFPARQLLVAGAQVAAISWFVFGWRFAVQ